MLSVVDFVPSVGGRSARSTPVPSAGQLSQAHGDTALAAAAADSSETCARYRLTSAARIGTHRASTLARHNESLEPGGSDATLLSFTTRRPDGKRRRCHRVR